MAITQQITKMMMFVGDGFFHCCDRTKQELKPFCDRSTYILCIVIPILQNPATDSNSKTLVKSSFFTCELRIANCELVLLSY
ncbi:hypothetical protein [Nostoc piscinale]|uniref:hypothetical protein n=1 Tax=Nostoc piscinale TaxID=224012 RepID=UPI000A489DB7|nr:hypothetical protein [Nostoc piscinale]